MKKRPIAAILHLFVYVGFVIINIELIEIIVDGIFWTHRFLSSIFGDTFYGIFTATLEILAALVVIAVVAFFIRRNGLKIPRLSSIDLKGWPKMMPIGFFVIEFCIDDGVLQNECSRLSLMSKERFGSRKFPYFIKFNSSNL